MTKSFAGLKEQLNAITGNISTINWRQERYYELLARLHLLLVKNNHRKAYFDETTLKSCKYFENCSDEQIDDVIVEQDPSYKPRIDALNKLQKVCKELDLQTHTIKQIPIEIVRVHLCA